MSTSSNGYAELSQDSYKHHQRGAEVLADGVTYQVIDTANNRSGYQGTAYRNMRTGEVVIAHRGTEFDREPMKDGVVDAGMVLAGVNLQSADAIAFTKQAIEVAKRLSEQDGSTLSVTVTGHSLGGTLAEITAHAYGLRGETFNAYGAAGLMQGIPEGGHQVINHVRATDVVSAASRHFGETHVYASRQDIDTLNKAGYRDDSGQLSLRNPVKGIDLNAHGIGNFVEDNQGHSIRSPESEARYRAHAGSIDRYRDDVLAGRTVVSIVTGAEQRRLIVNGATAASALTSHVVAGGIHSAERAGQELGQLATHAYGTTRRAVVQGALATERAATHAYDTSRDKVVQGVHAAEHAAAAVGSAAVQTGQHTGDAVAHAAQHAGRSLVQGAQVFGENTSRAFDRLTHPGSWLESKPPAAAAKLNHAVHPDHALFKQAQAGVHRLDAQNGRTPDQRSDNLAAALVVAACSNGMNRIDHVDLATDASKVFAVQGALSSPFKQIASVPTVEALNTSVAQSTQALNQAMQHMPQDQVHQPVQQQDHSQAHRSVAAMAR